MQEPVPGEVGGSRCPGREVPVEQRYAARGQRGDIGPADIAVDQGLGQARQRRQPPRAMLAEVEIEIGVSGAQSVEQGRNVPAEQKDLVEDFCDPAGRFDPPAGGSARIGEHWSALVERQDGQLREARARSQCRHADGRDRREAGGSRPHRNCRAVRRRPTCRPSASGAFGALAMKRTIDRRARERLRQAPREAAAPQHRLVERGAEERNAPGLRHELLEHEGAGIGLEREDIGPRCGRRRAGSPRSGRPAPACRHGPAQQRGSARLHLPIDYRKTGDEPVGRMDRGPRS